MINQDVKAYADCNGILIIVKDVKYPWDGTNGFLKLDLIQELRKAKQDGQRLPHRS